MGYTWCVWNLTGRSCTRTSAKTHGTFAAKSWRSNLDLCLILNRNKACNLAGNTKQESTVHHRSRLRKNKIQWTTWSQCWVFEALAHKTQKLSLQAEAILYARSALEDPSNLSLFPFSWWNSRKVHSLISLIHSIFPYPSTDLFCMIRAMFGPQKAVERNCSLFELQDVLALKLHERIWAQDRPQIDQKKTSQRDSLCSGTVVFEVSVILPGGLNHSFVVWQEKLSCRESQGRNNSSLVQSEAVLLATLWWKKVSSKRSRQRRSWRQNRDDDDYDSMMMKKNNDW